jgi:hypothetical protein
MLFGTRITGDRKIFCQSHPPVRTMGLATVSRLGSVSVRIVMLNWWIPQYDSERSHDIALVIVDHIALSLKLKDAVLSDRGSSSPSKQGRYVYLGLTPGRQHCLHKVWSLNQNIDYLGTQWVHQFPHQVVHSGIERNGPRSGYMEFQLHRPRKTYSLPDLEP